MTKDGLSIAPTSRRGSRTLSHCHPPISAAAVMDEDTYDDDDNDDDKAAPAPFNLIEFDTDNEWKRAAAEARRAIVETANEDDEDASIHFNSIEFGAENRRKRAVAA